MPETLYGLTAAQVERLKRILDSVDGGGEPPITQRGKRPRQPARVMVGALTSSIAAITGLLGTPTVGTLNVYSFSSTGTEDTGLDLTVYNFAPAAATTDRWTIAERDNMTGKWIITTQFCS